LETLSPLKVLSRGYAILKIAQNQVISSVLQVCPGQPVTITVDDGEISGRVEEIKGGQT
jgi:exonuclease VII large subunit